MDAYKLRPTFSRVVPQRLHNKRLATKITGRALLSGVLLCAGLLVTSSDAHAGYWKVSAPTDSGELNAKDNSQSAWYNYNPWDDGAYSQLGEGSESYEGSFDLWTTAETDTSYGMDAGSGYQSKGTVQISYDWVPNPDFASDPPPEKLSIRENCYVEVYFNNGGPARKVLINPLGGNEQYYTGGSYISSSIVHSYDSSSGHVSLPARYIETTIEAGNDPSSMGMFLGYNTRFDHRFDDISRVGAPPALPEKVRDPQTHAIVPNKDLVEDRDEWIEGDGTRHGHTLWSYKERVLPNPNLAEVFAGIFGYELYNDDDVPVNQVFQSTSSGWSANTTGSWNPSDPLDTKSMHSQVMPQGGAIDNPDGIDRKFVFFGDGGLFVTMKDIIPAGWLNTHSAGSPPIVIEHTLVDSTDSIESTSKYILNLHDEWEKKDTDPRYFTSLDDNPTPSGTPLPAIIGTTYEKDYYVPDGAVSVTKTTQNPTWSHTQTSDEKIELKSNFEANFKLGDWGNMGGSIETSKSLSVQAVIGTTAPNPATDPDFTLYTTDVQFLSVVVYDAIRKHFLVNHWGTYGYIENEATKGWTYPANYPATALRGTVITRGNPLWGKTPESKVEDLSNPRADWWPYDIGDFVPPVGSTGIWRKSGSTS